MSTPRHRAIQIAGATMGDLVSFWGFKSSTGRIWALLYLSTAPLPADAIAEQTGLSTGAVSMGLKELQRWGVADRAMLPGVRKRHYQAETDIWGVVRRIFRERELRMVDKARFRFQEAIDLLEAVEDPTEDDLHALARLRGLLGLAMLGYSMIETFARVGTLSLEPIRGVLSRER